jgi:hypothetical protein
MSFRNSFVNCIESVVYCAYVYLNSLSVFLRNWCFALILALCPVKANPQVPLGS